jgi:hypothetical protein
MKTDESLRQEINRLVAGQLPPHKQGHMFLLSTRKNHTKKVKETKKK